MEAAEEVAIEDPLAVAVPDEVATDPKADEGSAPEVDAEPGAPDEASALGLSRLAAINQFSRCEFQ